MFNKISGYFKDNGPAIATVGSMICTGLAVIFAIKNADKGVAAKELYIEEQNAIEDLPLADRKPQDEIQNKITYGVRLVKAYKESIILGGTAIVLTATANKHNAKTIAGLSAALAIREDKLKKLYRKADDIFGNGTASDLKEAVNCDVPPFDEDEIVKTTKRRRKNEKVERYYETHSGRAFEAYPSDVDAAIERAKKRAARDFGYLNYNKWSSLLGLPDLDIGIVDEWNANNPFEVVQKIVMVNGEEYIGLIYENDPVSEMRNYKKLY